MPKIYSESFKKVILDDLDKYGSITKVANKYKLNYSLIYRWNKERLSNKELTDSHNLSFFDFSNNDDNKITSNCAQDIVKENLLLRNIIVNKEMEIAKLKEILNSYNITL